MGDTRAADHALGVELQIEELVEQRERAKVQGRADDAVTLSGEITELFAELADTAEQATAPADAVPNAPADV